MEYGWGREARADHEKLSMAPYKQNAAATSSSPYIKVAGEGTTFSIKQVRP